ncbi:MAG TPA: hypothetical protein VFN76_02865, partial [Candidatus Limnocylindria bacterium]|nr:hypothetical protein [Candidatus Limnocylindria bacterium]
MRRIVRIGAGFRSGKYSKHAARCRKGTIGGGIGTLGGPERGVPFARGTVIVKLASRMERIGTETAFEAAA